METRGMDWVLSHDSGFRYRLLGRLHGDCLYYLGNGNRNPGNLWARSVTRQIAYMKLIWNSFPQNGKPERLTWEQIEQFEADMVAP